MARWVLIMLAVWAAAVHADEPLPSDRPLRMAVVGNAAPMSYSSGGVLTGFNVEMGRALCATLQTRCDIVVVPLGEVIASVASGKVDFAVSSLLTTPERRQQVLFTKPYYRSLSAWLARPGVEPGAHGLVVAVVRGSAQARYAQAQRWKTLELPLHSEMPDALSTGKAQAVLLPMLTAWSLSQDPRVVAWGGGVQVFAAPDISGDVAISVAPSRPELVDRLNQAIDQVKRDGRFDRIASEFLPFKLQ